MNALNRLPGRILLLIYCAELLRARSSAADSPLLLLLSGAAALPLAAMEIARFRPEGRLRIATALVQIALCALVPLFGGNPLTLFCMPLITLAAGAEAAGEDLQRQLALAFAAPLVGAAVLLSAWIAGRTETLPLLPLAGGTLSAAAASLMLRGLEREELRRTALLRKSLASKEAILSTMAHEVRTPVTVIQSTADIMREGRTGELAPTQREFLDAIASSARRLITFSENILASIKVESDWFAVRPVAVDIRGIIKNVAAHMGPVLEEKRQHLRYTFPKLLSRPPADPDWIHQVLVNLVHNASKHLSPGGRIIISVNENEQCVVVSVSDDGSGIRTAERLRVFEDYFQGDEYSESRLDGAGLGLAIVKRVVEKHAGRVYVSSVQGHGTTVSFTLPKNPGEESV